MCTCSLPPRARMSEHVSMHSCIVKIYIHSHKRTHRHACLYIYTYLHTYLTYICMHACMNRVLSGGSTASGMPRIRGALRIWGIFSLATTSISTSRWRVCRISSSIRGRCLPRYCCPKVPRTSTQVRHFCHEQARQVFCQQGRHPRCTAVTDASERRAALGYNSSAALTAAHAGVVLASVRGVTGVQIVASDQ